jgi:hypothetical protein
VNMPPLKAFADSVECFEHYRKVYCSGPIPTFDGIMVRFRKEDFLHCFFESSNRDDQKDTFSTRRAERIDWIKAALQDPKAELFAGWDRKRKIHDRDRRVCVVSGDYVVIIALTDKDKAYIITAFVIDDPRVLESIKRSPKWK